MRLLSSCLLVFVLASCVVQTQVPQVASNAVDPYRDVVIIPQDVCPKFGGWIAKTPEAQAAEDIDIIRQEHLCKLRIEDARGAQRLAELQFKRSDEALNRAAWLARWGFPLGVGVGMAICAIIAGTVYGIVQSVR